MTDKKAEPLTLEDLPPFSTLPTKFYSAIVATVEALDAERAAHAKTRDRARQSEDVETARMAEVEDARTQRDADAATARAEAAERERDNYKADSDREWGASATERHTLRAEVEALREALRGVGSEQGGGWCADGCPGESFHSSPCLAARAALQSSTSSDRSETK